mmetsp:Transcript_48574/g.56070  ORF Transcript_48574/g.56070 Transcript_48574/m.56070 type:complete len:265 (-) Transcript_48574:162-956(-)
MTTAHRPTWNAAVGGSEQGAGKTFVPSRSYSAKDLPGQTKMKERPQIDIDPKSNQYKNELLQREEEALAKKERREVRNLDEKNQPDLKGIEPPLSKKVRKDSEEKEDESKDIPTSKKKAKDDYVNPFPEDEDDEDFMKSDDSKSQSKSSQKSDEEKDDDNEDDSDDSDNERLLLEYERVKKEREEEQKRKDKERLEAIETQRRDEIMGANPLINNLEYSLKKKWFEDTVFKNQTKTEPKEKKRFINDTVRSDFHKKFMNKYIFN